MDDDTAPAIRLETWTDAGLSLPGQADTSEMIAHLGGPETEGQILDRHKRYPQPTDPGARQMLAAYLPDGRPASRCSAKPTSSTRPAASCAATTGS